MDRVIKALTTNNAKRSAFFYLGSFLLSFGNYLFHLMLLRLLSPAEYGEFLTYISFLYLLTIPNQTISILVTKYVSDFIGKQKNKKMNKFFYYLLSRLLLPTILMGLIVIATSKLWAGLFKAHPLAFIILGISLVTNVFGAIIGAYLMALQKFLYQNWVGFISLLIKLSGAYLLVTIGLRATGAIVALLSAGLFHLILVFWKIKSYIYPPESYQLKIKFEMKNLAWYSLLFSAGVMSLMSTDVLLVRYYFSPEASGYYSAISVLGRMIFFGLAPLSILLLPMVSNRYAAGKPSMGVLFKLLFANMGLGIIGVGIFSLVPELVIKILSGSQYLIVANLLPKFSLLMWLLSISNLLMSYLIAVNRHTSAIWVGLIALFQPGMIILFHQNLTQIVNINLITQGMLIVVLLIQIVTMLFYQTDRKAIASG